MENSLWNAPGMRVISIFIQHLCGVHYAEGIGQLWRRANLSGLKISNLGFVDDITLLASSSGETTYILQNLKMKSIEFGLIVNQLKTKNMVLIDSLQQFPEIPTIAC